MKEVKGTKYKGKKDLFFRNSYGDGTYERTYVRNILFPSSIYGRTSVQTYYNSEIVLKSTILLYEYIRKYVRLRTLHLPVDSTRLVVVHELVVSTKTMHILISSRMMRFRLHLKRKPDGGTSTTRPCFEIVA